MQINLPSALGLASVQLVAQKVFLFGLLACLLAPEVGDSRETLAYFFVGVQAPLLSACCASADLSALSGGGVSLCDNDAKS